MGVNYLLDTHVVLWWLFDDPKLGEEARRIIRDPAHQLFVSSASAWEIAIKYKLGKLPEAQPLIENYSRILQQSRFVELVITAKQALKAGQLPINHRDPFDRMLMAQAELESLPIVTYDRAFHDYTAFIQVIPS